MAKRTNVRPIQGLPAQGSRPRGSSTQLRAGITTSTQKPGPAYARQKATTEGGEGVNVNSTPA